MYFFVRCTLTRVVEIYSITKKSCAYVCVCALQFIYHHQIFKYMKWLPGKRTNRIFDGILHTMVALEFHNFQVYTLVFNVSVEHTHQTDFRAFSKWFYRKIVVCHLKYQIMVQLTHALHMDTNTANVFISTHLVNVSWSCKHVYMSLEQYNFSLSLCDA